jgi:hypothetical protein
MPPPPYHICSSLSLSLSSWALTYYVVAIAPSLDVPVPLSLRRRLYGHTNACLIAPLSRQWLVVASSPLSPRQCLSCRADASLVAPPPLWLRRGISCGTSPAPAGCCFANFLDVPPSLLSRRLVVALKCYLSLCTAVSLFATSLIAPPSFL